MAGHHVGLELVAEALGEGYAVKEYGRLGHLCLAQILLRAFKHEVCDPESKDLIGFLKHFADLRVAFVEVLAHSYELGALTGKYICFHMAVLNDFLPKTNTFILYKSP